MRFLLSGLLCVLAIGCASRSSQVGQVLRAPQPIKTQILTFPDGGVIEFNGKPAGRAPTAVILPQDTNGRLTERAFLRAIPNSAQPALFAQARTLEPSGMSDRVPDRILIDLTLFSTNAPPQERTNEAVHAATENKSLPARKMPRQDRGKPTRPVGVDRWSPGIY
jgi:hypothetical protein